MEAQVNNMPNKIIKLSEVKVLEPMDLLRRVDTNDTFKYSKIWKLIEANSGFRSILELMERIPLKEFIKESKKPYDASKMKDVVRSEVYYVLNIEDDNIESYWAFHGLGKDIKDRYALDFTPTNELMHLDVGFAKVTEFYDGKSRTLPAIPTPTVLDVFHAIIDEVAFNGLPVNRQERLNDLLERIKEIDSGKVKTIPWEDVKKTLKKRMKKWAATADQKRKSSKPSRKKA